MLCLQYTLQGKQIPGRIGLDAGTSPIVKVAFFRGTGVICISEDLQVFIVPSFKVDISFYCTLCLVQG